MARPAGQINSNNKTVQIAPIETDPAESAPYDSLQLLNQIFEDNKTSPNLEELRTKVITEQEDTWTLRDGLLLRYGKLYITEGAIQDVPLRTAVIREAHDQPLTGHPGRAKLRQLLQSRYYWPGQGKDIDHYYANYYTCRRAHVPRNKKPGLLQ